MCRHFGATSEKLCPGAITTFGAPRSEACMNAAMNCSINCRPVGVLKIASNLIPSKAAAELRESGVDLDAIIEAAEAPDAHGTLAVVEDHEQGERIVIAVE